jgi:hypothetical protein
MGRAERGPIVTPLQGSNVSALVHLRVYEPDECGADGYPLAWHDLGEGQGVKHLIRELAGHRCVRCLHPYVCGVSRPEWSPCDEQCRHDGPIRCGAYGEFGTDVRAETFAAHREACRAPHDARYRVLTVHHLDGIKPNLRWWNLAALCQRCHLTIQGRVQMARIYPWPHSDWFKPYVAGWYGWTYLGLDLTREDAEARMDELLALELAA